MQGVDVVVPMKQRVGIVLTRTANVVVLVVEERWVNSQSRGKQNTRRLARHVPKNDLRLYFPNIFENGR